MLEHRDALRRQILSVLGIQRRALCDFSKDLAQLEDDRFDGVKRGDRLDSDDVIVAFGAGHLFLERRSLFLGRRSRQPRSRRSRFDA